MATEFHVVNVQAARDGASANYKGRVTFAFVPNPLEPLKVKRSYVATDKKTGEEKRREDGTLDYREVVELEIEPGNRVTVKDAPIMVSQKGQAYIRTCLDISWEMSCQVADKALDLIEARLAGKGVA